MSTIKRFEDLECWQEARKLVNMVYDTIDENIAFQRDLRLSGQNYRSCNFGNEQYRRRLGKPVKRRI